MSKQLKDVWLKVSRHPQLPGDDLAVVEVKGGETMIYDRKNPQASIQGESVVFDGGDVAESPET